MTANEYQHRDGRKLAVKDPEKFGEVLALLAAGQSYNQIHTQTGAHWRTIAQIAANSSESVDEWRKQAAARTKEAAGLALERIGEHLADPEKAAKTGLKDLGITYGILTDKSLVLQGEATTITEQRAGCSVEAARQAIESARKSIQAESIDV